ncbi:MAG: DsrE family protein [Proteobacteria bacterium]|nr:DsrE family protein [Pseudomonadota bacterium]
MLKLMNYAVLINAQHDWQTTNKHAIKLIQALHTRKHNINVVFFYGHSVKLANSNTIFFKQWQVIQNKINCPLLVCHSMLEMFGIYSNINTELFQLTGMAQWVKLMEQADQVVELT